MSGTLYVVATPIGNLEDISLRALRVLREVDLICAEDTRITRKLLSHYDIHTPLIAFHQHTRGEKAEALAARLREGQNLALVTDAGTPGVSDPGGELIALALGQGSPVVPVPGPNAALTALVISGLFTGRFAFDGFPPRTKTDRRAFFDGLCTEKRTILLYESPARLLSTLEELLATLGDRPVAVARELTKRFEEVYRGHLSDAIAYVRQRPPRGEYTLVVGGASGSTETPSQTPDEIESALRTALQSGATGRDAVQQVAERLHLPRRLVYQILLRIQSRL